jgi:membrane associated rhomboid family serine protease
MTPTPVGMRCPECSRERTQVRRMPSVSSTPVATQALIAINVVAFLIETAAGAPLGGGGGGSVYFHGSLFGPAITAVNPYPFFTGTHEYWRLVTSGFLHDGLFHILINMVSLWFVGSALEPAIGRVNFLAVYFVSLLAGSFGALWFQPVTPTVGASGAIFGIFGALIIVARNRGIPIWQSGLGIVLVFNLVFSLSVRGISVGDHIGGLIGGLITGLLIVEVAERRRMAWAALAGCAVIGVASIIGALAVAGGHGLTPNGIGFTL